MYIHISIGRVTFIHAKVKSTRTKSLRRKLKTAKVRESRREICDGLTLIELLRGATRCARSK